MTKFEKLVLRALWFLLLHILNPSNATGEELREDTFALISDIAHEINGPIV